MNLVQALQDLQARHGYLRDEDLRELAARDRVPLYTHIQDYVSGAGGPDPAIILGSPMDERPGRSFADAQRSSGNTNDLRGKILRIRPLPDGTYAIPED